MVQESSINDFEPGALLSFGSDAFASLLSFEDKAINPYSLNEYLATEWRIHSPATSTSSEALSEGFTSSSGLVDILSVVDY